MPDPRPQTLDPTWTLGLWLRQKREDMSGNRLYDIIMDKVRREGPIPFSRYMELCLYHPEFGYYQRGKQVTGREGDFFTAPHVHRLFGTTVSRWIVERMGQMETENQAMVELGPGNGQLMEDILADWKGSGAGSGHRVELVEGSALQRDALAKRFQGRPVGVWDPDDWESITPFEGVVLANEFFDAIPLRVIAREGGELREVLVGRHENRPVEVLRSLEVEALDPALQEALAHLPEGQRLEFSDGWRTWLRRIFSKLKRGTVLIIDYGDTTEALTVPWRSSGTLRCYRKHMVDGDPYTFPGEKDITAHVNFSLLEKWAACEGLALESFTTQSSFLIRAGILELLVEGMEGREGDLKTMEEWLTVKNLITDEGGMGETFKVMVLKK